MVAKRKFSFQARAMLRFAKRTGFDLRPESGSYRHCIIGLVGKMLGFPFEEWERNKGWMGGTYPEALVYKTGIPVDLLYALEAGFEGVGGIWGGYTKYYTVGSNLRDSL
jgi:hypothetical protein